MGYRAYRACRIGISGMTYAYMLYVWDLVHTKYCRYFEEYFQKLKENSGFCRKTVI